MPAPGIELGVDFGTSNTVAVVRTPDGRSRSLLFDGSPLLPSAVYVEPSGTMVVGRDAIHSARLEPARFEPNPKRRIDDTSVLLGDRGVPVGQLIAAVLGRVGDEFRRTVGGAAPQVHITCPASWGATRRLVLSDAAVAAGLGEVRLVPEPVAAATYFAQVLGRAVPVGSVVVVHDFGAGTFDASVVARTATGFEVLAVDGRDDIGGLDVDQALIGHVERICEQRDKETWQRLASPTTVDDRRARRLLWDDVRVAKERLSRQPAADLTVPLLNVDIHVTREELEELARPILEQTVRVTQGVMRFAKLPEGRVAGVFLVGGSSRMPLVATLLHRALGNAPVAIDSPELVVAEGSLLATSAAVPVSAAPPPGPHTGVLPVLRPDGLYGPPPAGVGGPLSAAQVSAPGYAGPLSGGPVSGGSVSGGPVSGGPVSGGPVSGGPVSGGPVSGGPVSGGPVSGGPVSGGPVSGGPVSSGAPALNPTSGPPVPPNRPTSGGVVYATGRGVVPTAQPVQPGPPVAATRPMDRMNQPAPQAYRRAVPASPVYPPGGGPGPAQPAFREPTYREPAYPEPVYRESAYAEPARSSGSARRPSAAVRTLKVVVVTILLVLVPLTSFYVAFRLTVGQPVLPAWFR